MQTNKGQLSLYLHFPYCIHKCPYCDFNSYGIDSKNIKTKFEEEKYTEALIKEAIYYSQFVLNKTVTSIFLGGGTPSLFSEKSFSKIFETLKQQYTISESAEITCEVNPGSIKEELGKEKLISFKELGINRISLGCQSFKIEKLQKLGRWHSIEDTFRAVETVKAAKFTNFNLDLIYGLKDETLDTWKEEVETAISLQPKHLSLYSLTIEPGTEFSKRTKKGEVISDSESSAVIFEFNQDFLPQNNFAQYEVSNFAMLGFESQHNIGYWKRREYLGLGAGAHSFLKEIESESLLEAFAEKNINERQEKNSSNPLFGIRWQNSPTPKKYLEDCQEHGKAILKCEFPTKEQALTEFLLGLRIREGINRLDLKAYLDEAEQENFLKKVKSYGEQYFNISEENISLTKKGLKFADEIISNF